MDGGKVARTDSSREIDREMSGDKKGRKKQGDNQVEEQKGTKDLEDPTSSYANGATS